MAGIFRETVSFAVLITQGVIVITATTSIVSTMYNANDAEILLYLPVRSRNIFVAKLIIVYISQLASAFSFCVMCLYSFGGRRRDRSMVLFRLADRGIFHTVFAFVHSGVYWNAGYVSDIVVQKQRRGRYFFALFVICSCFCGLLYGDIPS